MRRQKTLGWATSLGRQKRGGADNIKMNVRVTTCEETECISQAVAVGFGISGVKASHYATTVSYFTTYCIHSAE
jgi:hypothetical protein